jgi:hypothetical protein
MVSPQFMPTRCESVAGESPSAAVWRLVAYDVDALRRDVASAIEGWDWSDGRYGHSLPLTTRRLTPFGRAHANNARFSDGEVVGASDERLDRCQYLSALFESLPSAKSSFRILRRPPFTSYTLHADVDVGVNTFRFQVPIVSDPLARVVVTDTPTLDALAIARSPHVLTKDWGAGALGAMAAYYDDLVTGDADHLCAYQLEPGYLYWFDTRCCHNVFNFGASDRLALVIDLVGDEWLFAQCGAAGGCFLPTSAVAGA